jgi:hypothetical protein
MKFHSLFALPSVALLLALPVQAETSTQKLEYQSAFEGYQAYSDAEIQNWPEANQLVDEIGGWRVYAREPYEKPADKPADSKEPAKQPTHHKHGGAQ